MPFVVAGYPPVKNPAVKPRPMATSEVLAALDGAGASVIEVGFPFSDPIADGPVIAAAMHEALEAGVTPAGIFDDVASIRPFIKAGLVAMVSVSIAWRWAGGPRGFVAAAARAGFDGFIFPDAPLEESGELLGACRDAGCTASLLVAPTSPPERVAAIAGACTGFVYVLARTGITGQATPQGEVAGRVGEAVKLVRRSTDLPVAVGFGITSAQDVRAVVAPPPAGAGADAAIVGSVIVKRMGESASRGQDPSSAAAALVAELAGGL